MYPCFFYLAKVCCCRWVCRISVCLSDGNIQKANPENWGWDGERDDERGIRQGLHYTKDRPVGETPVHEK